MQDTLYVGVDAHKKRSYVAVMDQSGTVIKSVDTDLTTSERFIVRGDDLYTAFVELAQQVGIELEDG